MIRNRFSNIRNCWSFGRSGLRVLLWMFCLSIFSGSFLVQAQSDEGYTVVVTVVDAHTGQAIEAAQAQTLLFEAAGTSDEEGKMTLSVSVPYDVLEVRGFGYNRAEVPLRGREEILVELYPDFFSTQVKHAEGAWGTARKSHNATGSVKLDEFGPGMYVSADEYIHDLLGGEVRSLRRSGLSGIGSSMFIRGFNSLNRNSQPLIVVDGVPISNFYDERSLHQGYFGNSLADLSAYDIESINVLKEGSAIYGSKGANGVVDIRTKRGRSVVTKIEVNAFAGITETGGKAIPVMDANSYRIFVSDQLTSAGIDPVVISSLDFLNDDPRSLGYQRYHNETDWADEVYRSGFVQSYNINVDGGDEHAFYAFSLGYTGEEGVVRNTDMQRLNTRFNADFNLSSIFDLGMNVAFTTVDRNLLDDGVAYYSSPSYLALIKAPFMNPYTFTLGGTETSTLEDYDLFGISNPNALIELALNTNKHYRFNVGVEPKVRLGSRFVFSNFFDYSLDKSKETYYSPVKGVAPLTFAGNTEPSENYFRGQVLRNVGLYNDAKLHYANVVNGEHALEGRLGVRYLLSDYRIEYGEGHNSRTDQVRNLINELEYRRVRGDNASSRYMSGYFNVDYDYAHRYFVSVAAAADASSRYGNETDGAFEFVGKSWGVFPGVNVAWLASSESFFPKGRGIGLLKLRAGYSITGNDDLDPYASLTYLMSQRYMDRGNALVVGAIGNSAVKWETTARLNAGLDLNLLNDRLSLNVDVFKNETSDLLVLREYPEVLGKGHYWTNEGSMTNTGAELAMNLKVLNLSKLWWEFGASVGHYKNEISALPNGRFITPMFGGEILSQVGTAAGVFYGYKSLGVISDLDDFLQEPLRGMHSILGEEAFFAPGDLRFEDVDGNGLIDSRDRQIIGDPNPDFYGSFNTRLGYRNFTASALFNFSYGNDIYNYHRSTLESAKDYRNQSQVMEYRWVAEGQRTTQPRAVYGDPMGNSRFSDRWIEDGSFLRLKTLSLSYKVPVRTQMLESLEIWFSGNNLWTLTDYLGRDPEVSAGNGVLYQGIDTGLLPGNRSFIGGIKLNL